MLGPAPLVDFDGTLTYLSVDWAALRGRLGVASISELWSGPDRWAVVTAAERAAAARSEPVAAVLALLADVQRFAVLTSNSAVATAEFLRRFPHLSARCATIVGREQLGGPKTEWPRFQAGFAACVSATAAVRGTERVTYVGDAAYELDFARRLGAVCYSVDGLINRPTAG